MKKGFGLLEVIIAAVVLGFLIVGLNKLQLGNREGVLRIRARDAASFVAQHVLDSLGSLGINSIQENDEAKGACESDKPLVYCQLRYTYDFQGNSGGISAPIDYKVEVELLSGTEKQLVEKTSFEQLPTAIYAKSLEAKVEWRFKGSPQSIKVAKVVR